MDYLTGVLALVIFLGGAINSSDSTISPSEIGEKPQCTHVSYVIGSCGDVVAEIVNCGGQIRRIPYHGRLEICS